MNRLGALLLLVAGITLVETAAAAQVAQLDLGEERPRAVTVHAGGFRPDLVDASCGDVVTEPPVGAAENAIYIVDAVSGEILWRAVGPGGEAAGEAGAEFEQQQMTHSIVAPVAVVDSDGNGIVDRAYVADTGGTLWRLVFPEAGSSSLGTVGDVLATYTALPLALLGGEGETLRSFYHQVDYVQSRDNSGAYDGILLVSGAPSGGADVPNYAYLVKDRGGQVVSHDQLPDITTACVHSHSTGCSDIDSLHGWKLALQEPGERGLSRPLVSGGVIYFTTHAPSSPVASSCEAPEGEGRLYAINLADGSGALQPDEAGPVEDPPRSLLLGPGIPGPVVPVGDQLITVDSEDEETVVARPTGPFRWRIYWREEGVDLL